MVIYSDGGDIIIEECTDCFGGTFIELDTYHDPSLCVDRSYNGMTLDELETMANDILAYIEKVRDEG